MRFHAAVVSRSFNADCSNGCERFINASNASRKEDETLEYTEIRAGAPFTSTLQLASAPKLSCANAITVYHTGWSAVAVAVVEAVLERFALVWVGAIDTGNTRSAAAGDSWEAEVKNQTFDDEL